MELFGLSRRFQALYSQCCDGHPGRPFREGGRSSVGLATLLATWWHDKAVPTVPGVSFFCFDKSWSRLWFLLERRYWARERHLKTGPSMGYSLLVDWHSVEIFSTIPASRGGLYPVFQTWYDQFEWPYVLLVPTSEVICITVNGSSLITRPLLIRWIISFHVTVLLPSVNLSKSFRLFSTNRLLFRNVDGMLPLHKGIRSTDWLWDTNDTFYILAENQACRYTPYVKSILA